MSKFPKRSEQSSCSLHIYLLLRWLLLFQSVYKTIFRVWLAITMFQYYICIVVVLTVILVLVLGLGFGIILYFESVHEVMAYIFRRRTS